MRDLKNMTAIVYVCVAGVGVSLVGGIYTGVRAHQEAARPAASVFPTPPGLGAAAVPARPGVLPTPAR